MLVPPPPPPPASTTTSHDECKGIGGNIKSLIHAVFRFIVEMTGFQSVFWFMFNHAGRPGQCELTTFVIGCITKSPLLHFNPTNHHESNEHDSQVHLITPRKLAVSPEATDNIVKGQRSTKSELVAIPASGI